MVRQNLAVIMAAVISGLVRAENWAGEQFLKCMDEVHEFGLDWKVEATARSFAGANRGQLGLRTILAAFVVVIAAMVVTIVLDTFDQSLGTPADSNLSAASNSVLSGFADMIDLVAPLLLIAIGVVIIGLIRRVQ